MGRDLERKAGDKPIEDATNAAFWNQLAEKVRETAVFGPPAEWADVVDDMFDADPDPEWEAREEAMDQAVRGHALTRLAEDYMKQTGSWLEKADPELKAVAKELLDAPASRFGHEDVEEEARQIGEMIEVVAWYHTLIPSKARRAVRGLLESAETEGGEDSILAEVRLEDAHGSGKVTLVAIERSIGAWLHLRDVLPRHESEILRLLALLERMRRGLMTALPGAISFKRPGFDEA